ncbi:hypothetical protein AAC387_Pa06g2363 [Persea americana]
MIMNIDVAALDSAWQVLKLKPLAIDYGGANLNCSKEEKSGKERISSLSLTPWFQPKKEKLCAQFPRSPRGSLPLFAVSLSAGKALSPWELHLFWLGSVQ